jgi:hypothetical protein
MSLEADITKSTRKIKENPKRERVPLPDDLGKPSIGKTLSFLGTWETKKF